MLFGSLLPLSLAPLTLSFPYLIGNVITFISPLSPSQSKAGKKKRRRMKFLGWVFVVFVAFVLASVHGCPIPVPPWSCPSLPPPPLATNVRQLRPGNIKAIMALGDSITAGFAMIGYPPESLLEWRDYGYATGGADGAFTLANILHSYNPNIQGASQSWTWPLTNGAWLNGAVSHASVQNTPSQVAYLVQQLKTTYKYVNDYSSILFLSLIFS